MDNLSFYDLFLSEDYFEKGPAKTNNVGMVIEKPQDNTRGGAYEDLEDEQRSEEACPIVPRSPRDSISSKRGSDCSPFLGIPAGRGSVGSIGSVGDSTPSVPIKPKNIKKEGASTPSLAGSLDTVKDERRSSTPSDALLKTMAINKALSESNADFALDLTPFENPFQMCTAEEEEERKLAKLEKNRKSARECRKRKKEYVKGVESRLETCNRINKTLMKKIEDLESQNAKLLKELRQLKRANKS
eukprot:Nk52_evm16s352 gene=Nk52_evmTU16s352